MFHFFPNGFHFPDSILAYAPQDGPATDRE